MTFSWLTVTYELIGAIGKFIIIGIKANSTSVRDAGKSHCRLYELGM